MVLCVRVCACQWDSSASLGINGSACLPSFPAAVTLHLFRTRTKNQACPQKQASQHHKVDELKSGTADKKT